MRFCLLVSMSLLNDNLVPVVLAVIKVLAPVDGTQLEDPQARRRRVAARAAQARATALLGIDSGGGSLRGSGDRSGNGVGGIGLRD